MFKKKLLLGITVCATLSTQAQTHVDALRFSQLTFGGTARSVGIGGAFGSLGADFSAVSINPAGLGIYRSSEIMFSPSMVSSRTQSTYLSNEATAFRYNFNIGNFGVVVNSTNDKEDASWTSTSFALGYNRVANFDNQVFFEGFNTKSSILNNYLERANGFSSDALGNLHPFDVNLAWNTFLLDLDTLSNDYFIAIPNARIQQSKEVTTRGAIDEYMFALGSSYKNKLYIGASLGISRLRYTESSTYTEQDTEDTVANFVSFTQYGEVSTRGVGANFKFGLIYRPVDWVRIGGAFHSPTFFSLRDRFSSSIDAVFDTISYSDASPNGIYDYFLSTPWRVNTSVAFIIKKYGFITAEFEFLDYGSAFFSDESGTSAEDRALTNVENRSIQGLYGPTFNYKIGAEGRIDIFRLRAGFAQYGSPFKSGQAEAGGDNSRQAISFGMGIREADYYLDFGYSRALKKEAHIPYTLDSSNNFETALLESGQNTFVLTVGFTF